MTHGKIYLIPTIISSDTHFEVLSPQVRDLLPHIRHFLAEDIRTARRYLSGLKIYDTVESLSFEVLNKDTVPGDLKNLLAPVFDGFPLGILSESGCPGIADPGSLAVNFAHQQGVRVVPLVGPSSILLGLMASGLNGQRFAFHGYLPIKAKEAGHSIIALEKESRTKNQTQIFIETPYRNNVLFQLLLKNLREDTLLCLAIDVTGKSEEIQMHPVRDWRKMEKELHKIPVVFLFLAR